MANDKKFVVKNGLTAGSTPVIDENGLWIGPTSGIIGYSGSQGGTGFTGSAGFTGSQGIQGVTGFTGSIGFTGSRGNTGFTGSQGVTGFTGSQGIQGITGFTGSQGIQGVTGFTGSQGIQGIQGIQGFTGSVGNTGFTGSLGATGFTGSTGFVGSRGYGGGLPWQFETSTVMGLPTSGYFRFNNATPSSVTSIAFNATDALGNGHRTYLLQWANSTNPVKAYITMVGYLQRDYVYEITGVVDNTTWVQLNVSFVSGAGALTPTSGEIVSIDLSRSGNLGFTGSQGTTGFVGSTGDKGGVKYTFTTTTTDADPGAGVIAYNNAAIASVTNLFIDNVDAAGITQTAWYDTWDDSTTTADRGYIYLVGNVAGSTVVNIFRVTGAVTNATTYYKIPVAYVSGTLPANSTVVQLSFSRTGNLGFTGSFGNTGFTGSIGFTGSQGIQGTTGFTGSQGIQGVTGFTGSQGIQGVTGFTGSLGFTGSQGIQGVTGFTGSQGIQGVTGFTGSQGIQGVTGFTGSQGIQGVTGFTGSQGIQGVTGFTGSKGDIGFTGSQGIQGVTGFTGSKGDIGFTGSKGQDGNFGGATFDYTFDSTITSADPGVGRLKFNNATLSSATSLFIDASNDASTDISTFLNTIDDSTSTIKGHFRVSKKFDPATFALYTITSLTNNTGWYTVVCSYVSGSGTFANNDDIIVTFARTGDKGDTGFTGSQGSTGFTGSQGIQGITGFTGSIGFTGSQGVQGTIGFTGSQGIQGNQGIQGFTGSVGNTGFTGSIGFTGSRGATGFTGSVGFTGSIGFTGSQGIQGTTGFTGSQGIQGVTGFTGSQGIQGVTGFTGSQGIQGVTGFTGSFGNTGFTGSFGTTGFVGSTGDKGGVKYTFTTVTTDADPGAGLIAYNNAAIASVTNLFIDNVDAAGITQTAWYDTWDDSTTTADRGYIYVVGNVAGSTVVNIFRVTGAVTVATGYYKIPVAYVSGTLPANSTVVQLSFSRTGNLGFTGSQGIQGVTGFTGSQGIQGVTGFTGLQGIQGVTGFTGSQGIQGVTGFTGSFGNTGFAGSIGFTGSRGATGFTGSVGNTGFTGSLGFTGSQGFNTQTVATAPTTPNNGDLWFDTESGTIKVYYNDGDTAQWVTAAGVQGAIGFTGSRGATGFTGSFGNTGFTGSFGTTGFTGSFGATGFTGSFGATGFTGSMPTAGGSTGSIQYNSGGLFGGNSNLIYDSVGNTLTLTGTDPEIQLGVITTEPAAPASGHLRLYAKSYAGRTVIKSKGASGLDTPYQAALWSNNTVFWTPTGVTAGLWVGTVGTSFGTFTQAFPTVTTTYTTTRRSRYANVATTANQVLGQRNADSMFFRGNADNQGGFFFYSRFGFDVWTNGGRMHAGLHTATTVVTAQPSALANTVGFHVDTTDNGLIYFGTRDATTLNRVSTGFTITSNKGYDVYMYCAPGIVSSVSWRIVDINLGTEASGTLSANLPTANTMLTAGVLASNAALTAVTAIQIGINRIYVETDY